MEINIVKTIQSLNSGFFDVFSEIFSYISNYFGFILITLIFFVFINKKYSLFIFFTYLISIGFNFIFKLIISRQRPYDVDATIINKLPALGSSFPSGHTISATLICFFILFYIFQRYEKRWVRILSVSLSAIFILCVGFSRIYLGQHYLSDILGGLLFGLFYCLLSFLCYNKFIKRDDYENFRNNKKEK